MAGDPLPGARPSGLVPSLCGEVGASVLGQWVGGFWGALPGPRECAGDSQHKATRPIPSANAPSPLFQAVELTAFKCSGNLCLHHVL